MKKTMTKLADGVLDDLGQARTGLTDGVNGHAHNVQLSAAQAKDALNHSLESLKSTALGTAASVKQAKKKTQKKAHKAQKKAHKKTTKQARALANASRRPGPTLVGVAAVLAVAGGAAAVLVRRMQH